MLQKIWNFIFGSAIAKKRVSENEQDVTIPTSAKLDLSPAHIATWAKENNFEALSPNEQRDMYLYSKILDEAAESNSTQLIPNFDARHGAIAIAAIISFSKEKTTLFVNEKSHEVLEKRICKSAIAKAQASGKEILVINSNHAFIAINDLGMMRLETCPSQHTAHVVL